MAEEACDSLLGARCVSLACVLAKETKADAGGGSTRAKNRMACCAMIVTIFDNHWLLFVIQVLVLLNLHEICS